MLVHKLLKLFKGSIAFSCFFTAIFNDCIDQFGGLLSLVYESHAQLCHIGFRQHTTGMSGDFHDLSMASGAFNWPPRAMPLSRKGWARPATAARSTPAPMVARPLVTRTRTRPVAGALRGRPGLSATLMRRRAA